MNRNQPLIENGLNSINGGIDDFTPLVEEYQNAFLNAFENAINQIPTRITVDIEASKAHSTEIIAAPFGKVAVFSIILDVNLMSLAEPSRDLSKFFSFLNEITTDKKLHTMTMARIINIKRIFDIVLANMNFFESITDEYVPVTGTLRNNAFSNQSEDEKIEIARILYEQGFIENVGNNFMINARKLKRFLKNPHYKLPIKIQVKTKPGKNIAKQEWNNLVDLQKVGVRTLPTFYAVHQRDDFSTIFNVLEDIRLVNRERGLFKRPAHGKPDRLGMIFKEIGKMHRSNFFHLDLKTWNIAFAIDERGNPVIILNPIPSRVIPFKNQSSQVNTDFLTGLFTELSVFLGQGSGIGNMLGKEKGTLSEDDKAYIKECIELYLNEVLGNPDMNKRDRDFISAYYEFSRAIQEFLAVLD